MCYNSLMTITTYLLVNKVTGDTYVGRTKQKFEKRMRQHRVCTSKLNTPLGNNIRRYGWDNFQTEVLCEEDKEKESLNVPYEPPYELGNAATKRRVRCVETGQIFESQMEADKWVGIPKGVNNAVQGRARTCGGYHWELVDK